MGEGNEGRRKGIESLSLQTENYPGHLLQRFIFSSSQKSEFWDADEDEESEDVELSLGLSLGGRFGVDKNSKKLTRSSSIASTITIIRGDDALNPPVVAFPALMRTSSLPTETEEEWRKRKDLQSLRRMEAKRRRSEKQRCKEVAGGCFEEGRPEIEGLTTVNFWEKKEISLAEENKEGLTAHQHNRVAAAAKQALFGGIVDVVKKGKGGCPVGYGGGERGAGPLSQGSTESQAGSLSGMSELESKPLHGSSSYGEARISSCNSMLREQGDEEAGGGSSKTKTKESTSGTWKERTKLSAYGPDAVSSGGGGGGGGGRGNSVEDMPCVFTVGAGPNGRRVEGILYRYGKGEDVRIMCVCHGAFLSPAEFVKHAGGGDVAHPLRHIVVNPNSSLFL